MKKKIAVLTSGWAVDIVRSFLDGMKEAAFAKNTDLYVFLAYKFNEPDGQANTTGFSIYDLINYKDYDGVIITPNLFNDQARAEEERLKILKSGVPAVSIYQPMEGMSFISSINHQSFKNQVLHLIKEHGCKNLAFIGGPANDAGAVSNYQAFKEALCENNLPLNEKAIFLNGDFSYEWAFDVAKNLLKKNKNLPDAVVCVNDLAAMACECVCSQRGISVPRDIKIVGFDNVSFSPSIIPSLTTIDCQDKKMGHEAVDLVLRKPSKPETLLVKAKNIYRQSCGCQTILTDQQTRFSLSYPRELDASQRFASHLRHMEDVFIKYQSTQELNKNLENFYLRRHSYEGDNMAILLNESLIKELEEGNEGEKENFLYDKKMRPLVMLVDGKIEKSPLIKTRALVPQPLMGQEAGMYIFMPILNQKYIHGYYVGKNNTDILINKNAYNWTRNFGTIIEKFRQTSRYRIMSQELLKLSTKDALSGLLNRRGMEIYAQKLFEKNIAEKKNTEIIFADINDMKMINDRYGHLHGDLAVKTMAETIRSAIPEDYLAIRYGGDEFVIIGQKKNKVDYCREIENDLQKRTKNMSLPYQLTVSLGQKLFDFSENLTLSEAITQVDKIMYEDKKEYHRKK